MFIDWRDKLKRIGSRVVFCDIPIAMHCHHYNINLQKMIEDTLGHVGICQIYKAAEESNYSACKSMFESFQQIKSSKSKLEFAAIIYQHCGLGVINLQNIGQAGGRITSTFSHHVTGWLAKHGIRKTPGCHFTRGWVAGVLEAIYDLPLGSFEVKELRCKMMRDPVCEFDVKRSSDGC